MADEGNTTLLEFPCRFPIKAMGRNSEGFEKIVLDIVLAHAGVWQDEPVRSVPSSAGKFVSVTIVVEAQSKEQLDTIYQGLTDCEHVLMAL